MLCDVREAALFEREQALQYGVKLVAAKFATIRAVGLDACVWIWIWILMHVSLTQFLHRSLLSTAQAAHGVAALGHCVHRHYH